MIRRAIQGQLRFKGMKLLHHCTSGSLMYNQVDPIVKVPKVIACNVSIKDNKTVWESTARIGDKGCTAKKKRTLILSSEDCQLWSLPLFAGLADRQHYALGNLFLPLLLSPATTQHHHTPTTCPHANANVHTCAHSQTTGGKQDKKRFLFSILLPKVRDGTTDSFISLEVYLHILSFAKFRTRNCLPSDSLVQLSVPCYCHDIEHQAAERCCAVTSRHGKLMNFSRVKCTLPRAADLERSEAFPPSARGLSLNEGTKGN